MAGNPYHRGGGQQGGRFTSAAEAGAQGAMSEKAARATFVLENDGSVEDLEHEVAGLLRKLGAMGRPGG